MTQKKHLTIVATLLVAGVLLAVGIAVPPQALEQLALADQPSRPVLTPAQIDAANNLSGAFKTVAKSVSPSVVSISSVKRARPSQTQQRRFNNDGLPPEFRRFFGEDVFKRFSQELPSPQQRRQQGLGSGVVMTKDGYIVTNNHVVNGADEITVTFDDDRQLPASVVGTDKATDIAVLKVEATGLQPARWGKSTQLEVGDWVLAVGSPFGLDHTVTAGIVSAKGRANMGITDYEDFIQTDAAINPGNSGGPLLNLRGEVVGINTAIASRSGTNMGIGFAIPSDMASQVMQKLVTDGEVKRGYLGVMIQDLNAGLAESFSFDGTDGVLVGDVVKDGPGAAAGLQPGDIVLSFNGKPVSNATQLRNAVAATPVGRQTQLQVFRNGKTLTLAVRIAELEDKSEVVSKAAEQQSSDFGVTVQTLTPGLAKQLGYPDKDGVVVKAVEPSTPASSIGIEKGDIIVSVAGSTISTAESFQHAISKQDLKSGVRLQIWRDGVRRYLFVKNG